MEKLSRDRVAWEEDGNWIDCEKCGAKRLVDPETALPEACAECQSRSMSSPLWGGSVFLAIIAILILIAMFLGGYMLFVQFS